ncbi:helix-turn-helix domain-containing protein [Streptomyces sp. NPDC054784]
MSLEATVWALKFAPPMPPQLLGTLIGLAEHADARGRGAYPSVPTLAAYACKSERSVQRDIKSLLELSLIRRGDQRLADQLPADKRPEVYDLALERCVPGGRAGDEAARTELAALTAGRARGGRQGERGDAHVTSDGVTPTSPGDAHVTPRGDAHVASGVTPTSQRGDVGVTQTTHEPSIEPKDKDSSANGRASTDSPNEPRAQTASKKTEHLEAFGAFWTNYPKKRAREEARKAWIAAIERGADPERMVTAAQAYARERFNQDPQYTKYPATWLNKGCYDDEPDPTPAGRRLRAVGPAKHINDMTEEELADALRFA